MIMIGILAKNWSDWNLSPAQFLENLAAIRNMEKGW